jgi:hypothetical protein
MSIKWWKKGIFEIFSRWDADRGEKGSVELMEKEFDAMIKNCIN